MLLTTALIGIGQAAAPASAEDLEESTGWALRNSLSLQSEVAKQDAAAARLQASIDAFMPTVSYVQERILSSKITYFPDFSATFAATAGQSTTIKNQPHSNGVVATLPLFDGFKRLNTMRAAEIGVEATRFLHLDKRQQVVVDAANAYLAVLRDRRIVELRRKQLQDVSEIAKRAGARYSVRDATLADVFISKSRVEAVQTQLEQAMADLEASRIEYQRMTDAEPGLLREPRVPHELVPKTVEEFRQCMLDNNPKMKASQLEARIAGYNARAAVADFLPQVNLAASHVRQSNVTEAVDQVTDTTVKIQLKMPIYQPGTIGKINEAEAIARQKHWDDADSRKSGLASATTLYMRRLSTFNQIGRATERVRAMQKAVESFRIEQDAGLRTVIDVLNTQNELTEAQIARANLEYLRDSQTFALVAALARLTPPSPDSIPGGNSILQLAKLTR